MLKREVGEESSEDEEEDEEDPDTDDMKGTSALFLSGLYINYFCFLLRFLSRTMGKSRVFLLIPISSPVSKSDSLALMA